MNGNVEAMVVDWKWFRKQRNSADAVVNNVDQFSEVDAALWRVYVWHSRRSECSWIVEWCHQYCLLVHPSVKPKYVQLFSDKADSALLMQTAEQPHLISWIWSRKAEDNSLIVLHVFSRFGNFWVFFNNSSLSFISLVYLSCFFCPPGLKLA